MGTDFLRLSLHSRRPPLSIMAIKDNSFMILCGDSLRFILYQVSTRKQHPPKLSSMYVLTEIFQSNPAIKSVCGCGPLP
jgi:hypothetical protein